VSNQVDAQPRSADRHRHGRLARLRTTGRPTWRCRRGRWLAPCRPGPQPMKAVGEVLVAQPAATSAMRAKVVGLLPSSHDAQHDGTVAAMRSFQSHLAEIAQMAPGRF